ncbi:hypothetical protein GCT13_23130 [Paraburkholderia sp. CNPSo 3157]|uniref:Uncharacterized protein n=1 Tax=Paraburkholderia franconis TaxID=2654983 RepID=A0A7X1ND20_9BURK|nr:hypothetical protein [Paraburkholderia franconis]
MFSETAPGTSRSATPVGLPSTLAHRRPDIRRAEASPHAARPDGARGYRSRHSSSSGTTWPGSRS